MRRGKEGRLLHHQEGGHRARAQLPTSKYLHLNQARFTLLLTGHRASFGVHALKFGLFWRYGGGNQHRKEWMKVVIIVMGRVRGKIRKEERGDKILMRRLCNLSIR